MPSDDGRGHPNVHPQFRKINSDGCLSDIHGHHLAPPEDDPAKTGGSNTSILDTGWTGPIPSQSGGDSEPGFMNKPPYSWNSVNFERKHYSRCWCGNVEFQFHGDPVGAKYCHCKQCQHLHGAPFQWAVIFPKASVRMIANKDDSLHFLSTQRGQGVHDVPCKVQFDVYTDVRVSCNACRSPIFDEGRNTVLAYPSAFKFPSPKVPASFQPTAHIFYSQRIMDVPDGVPKWSGHKNESELLLELTREEGYYRPRCREATPASPGPAPREERPPAR
ncbi:Mss4-like protein [Ganoderma leucocontextum]|nr:Mss4-like protein [Ganoderma leucocontextum]